MYYFDSEMFKCVIIVETAGVDMALRLRDCPLAWRTVKLPCLQCCSAAVPAVVLYLDGGGVEAQLVQVLLDLPAHQEVVLTQEDRRRRGLHLHMTGGDDLAVDVKV